LCLPCNDSKGTGERRALAHTGGKERCCACNEVKLPVKEFGTDRTARDGARSRCNMCGAAARAMRRIDKCRRVT
jgi:hypothetical protein